MVHEVCGVSYPLDRNGKNEHGSGHLQTVLASKNPDVNGPRSLLLRNGPRMGFHGPPSVVPTSMSWGPLVDVGNSLGVVPDGIKGHHGYDMSPIHPYEVHFPSAEGLAAGVWQEFRTPPAGVGAGLDLCRGGVMGIQLELRPGFWNERLQHDVVHEWLLLP